MNRPETLYWSLMNQRDLRQVTGLTYAQAAFMVSLIPKTDYQNWVAWYEGLNRWAPLDEMDALTRPKPGAANLHMAPVGPDLDPSASPDTENRKATVEVDKRLNRRFLKNFKVQITATGGGTFTTSTMNISSSGMLLKDTVPPAIGKSFSCLITRDDGSEIKLFGALVRSTDPIGSRVKFLDVSHPKVLLDWLISSRIS